MMVQTRSRIRSLPTTPMPSFFSDGKMTDIRAKSLVSLPWCTEIPSPAESDGSSGGVCEFFSPATTFESFEKQREKSISLSSLEELQRPIPIDAFIIDNVTLPSAEIEPPIISDLPVDGTQTDKISTSENLENPTKNEPKEDEIDDDVFQYSSAQSHTPETAPDHNDPGQLSVIAEEKDDSETAPHYNTQSTAANAVNFNGETERSVFNFGAPYNEYEDDEDEVGFDMVGGSAPANSVHARVRQRPSAPILGAMKSVSSFDIRHSYSQPERLSSEGNGEDGSNVQSTTASSKLPVRRKLSSNSLSLNADAEMKGGRPFSQNFDDEGTILTALCMVTKNFDRSFSASTPSIDSVVNEAARGPAQERESAAIRNKNGKHSRTPSMVVPAITPRIPLMGILPTKVKSGERTGENTKPKERSSGFFGSRSKRNKSSEIKPHFWIKNSCSNSDCCEVCAKPLANTDAYQCNNCFFSVHSSCKTSLDKTSCVKMKHPKPSKTQQNTGPLRSSNVDVAAAIHALKFSREFPDEHPILIENARQLQNQRHSVASFPSEMVQTPSYATAPAALAPQFPCRFYPNGFCAFTDMEAVWEKLGLWHPSFEAWSTGPGKSEKKKMTSKEVKRQDIIHEMFVTEQHHCQTLTVLKHTYFDGLASQGIISAERLRQLLPGLDELIEIHYSFLRRLKEKKDETVIVDSVHDVLHSQFSGQTAERMISSYTQFCFQKDATVREYNRLINSGNPAFSAFIKTWTANPFYKSRSLPDCLLLVTQRLSKYHSFVENLRKNTPDDPNEKDGILIAERAVKELVTSVDSGIEKAQMQQARFDIGASMDPKAAIELATGAGENVDSKAFFKVEDLRSPDRTLLYYGDVFWQNARQKPAEVTLLLFTDFIVFLQKNSSGGYSFFKQDGKCGVIKLQNLFVRDKAGRLGSQGIYLIATSPKPEMYDVTFKSKKEIVVWMDRIQRAIRACPAPGFAGDTNKHSLLTGKEEGVLHQYFDQLDEKKSAVKTALNAECNLYSDLFDYLAKLPLKNNEDKNKIVSLMDKYFSGSGIASVKEKASTVWCAIRDRYNGESNEIPIQKEAFDDERDGPSGSAELGRSNTFHGAIATAAKKPKLRKHPTVAGIPEMDGRPEKRASVPQLFYNMLNSGDSSETFESASTLLHLWNETDTQIEDFKQENLRLTAELALAKERMRPAAGAVACDNGLENLRRLTADLEANRKRFQQEASDKQIELQCKEKMLKEKEESLAREDAEIRICWERLYEAWDHQRLSGMPLPPLAGSPSISNTSWTAGSPDSGAVSPLNSTYPPASLNQSNTGPHSSDSPHAHTSAVQRAPSTRINADTATAPMHLMGSAVLGGRIPEEARQQLPTDLAAKNDARGSLSMTFRASSKEKKSGQKKSSILTSSRSSSIFEKQMIPNKLASSSKK